mmetsp:Transcript_165299/g.530578  ORF Transcript_165299/g.530578 Transcript_165299/m.530578 type:complete len:391 (-) Transcript_165299:643-1815(-)
MTSTQGLPGCSPTPMNSQSTPPKSSSAEAAPGHGEHDELPPLHLRGGPRKAVTTGSIQSAPSGGTAQETRRQSLGPVLLGAKGNGGSEAPTPSPSFSFAPSNKNEQNSVGAQGSNISDDSQHTTCVSSSITMNFACAPRTQLSVAQSAKPTRVSNLNHWTSAGSSTRTSKSVCGLNGGAGCGEDRPSTPLCKAGPPLGEREPSGDKEPFGEQPLGERPRGPMTPAQFPPRLPRSDTTQSRRGDPQPDGAGGDLPPARDGAESTGPRGGDASTAAPLAGEACRGPPATWLHRRGGPTLGTPASPRKLVPIPTPPLLAMVLAPVTAAAAAAATVAAAVATTLRGGEDAKPGRHGGPHPLPAIGDVEEGEDRRLARLEVSLVGRSPATSRCPC